jgi:cytochrome oxidase Cu insertion factor (SCO1/SenC/PrrC family)
VKLSPRLTLALLALVCALPVAASYLTYYLWPPAQQMNYGELLRPAPMPEGVVTPIAGLPYDPESLQGHWVLVYAGPAACDGACAEALYFMRQVRTAQGKEMERVKRLWLVTDAGVPPASVLVGQQGLEVARTDPAWLARLTPDASGLGRVHLMDPLGLIMLRYPPGPEPKRMIKDLERLLKYSRVG